MSITAGAYNSNSTPGGTTHANSGVSISDFTNPGLFIVKQPLVATVNASSTLPPIVRNERSPFPVGKYGVFTVVFTSSAVDAASVASQINNTQIRTSVDGSPILLSSILTTSRTALGTVSITSKNNVEMIIQYGVANQILGFLKGTQGTTIQSTLAEPYSALSGLTFNILFDTASPYGDEQVPVIGQTPPDFAVEYLVLASNEGNLIAVDQKTFFLNFDPGIYQASDLITAFTNLGTDIVATAGTNGSVILTPSNPNAKLQILALPAPETNNQPNAGFLSLVNSTQTNNPAAAELLAIAGLDVTTAINSEIQAATATTQANAASTLGFVIDQTTAALGAPLTTSPGPFSITSPAQLLIATNYFQTGKIISSGCQVQYARNSAIQTRFSFSTTVNRWAIINTSLGTITNGNPAKNMPRLILPVAPNDFVGTTPFGVRPIDFTINVIGINFGLLPVATAANFGSSNGGSGPNSGQVEFAKLEQSFNFNSGDVTKFTGSKVYYIENIDGIANIDNEFTVTFSGNNLTAQNVIDQFNSQVIGVEAFIDARSSLLLPANLPEFSDILGTNNYLQLQVPFSNTATLLVLNGSTGIPAILSTNLAGPYQVVGQNLALIVNGVLQTVAFTSTTAGITAPYLTATEVAAQINAAIQGVEATTVSMPLGTQLTVIGSSTQNFGIGGKTLTIQVGKTGTPQSFTFPPPATTADEIVAQLNLYGSNFIASNINGAIQITCSGVVGQDFLSISGSACSTLGMDNPTNVFVHNDRIQIVTNAVASGTPAQLLDGTINLSVFPCTAAPALGFFIGQAAIGATQLFATSAQEAVFTPHSVAVTGTESGPFSFDSTTLVLNVNNQVIEILLTGTPATITALEPADSSHTGVALSPSTWTSNVETFVNINALVSVPGTVEIFNGATHVASDNGSGSFSDSFTELAGTGNGTQVSFTYTTSQQPVVPFSVTITAGTVTGTDNGILPTGAIGVAGISGTIVYATGIINITFSTAPLDGVKIDVVYSHPYFAYAEAIITGTVNYATGVLSTTFYAATNSGLAITANYTGIDYSVLNGKYFSITAGSKTYNLAVTGLTSPTASAQTFATAFNGLTAASVTKTTSDGSITSGSSIFIGSGFSQNYVGSTLVIASTPATLGTWSANHTFTSTLSPPPIVAGSIQIFDSVGSTLVATDNGLGIITGSDSGGAVITGSIQYPTGALSVTFTGGTPTSGTITAKYSTSYEIFKVTDVNHLQISNPSYVSPSLGTATPSNTTNGVLANFPVSPSTVVVYDGTHIIATDNGSGALSGSDDTSAITGSISYSSGAISIIFGAGTVYGGSVTVQYSSTGFTFTQNSASYYITEPGALQAVVITDSSTAQNIQLQTNDVGENPTLDVLENISTYMFSAKWTMLSQVFTTPLALPYILSGPSPKILPGSIRILDGSNVIATDNGLGIITGSDSGSTITSGTITYIGAGTPPTANINFTFSGGTPTGGTITVKYANINTAYSDLGIDWSVSGTNYIGAGVVAQGTGTATGIGSGFYYFPVNRFSLSMTVKTASKKTPVVVTLSSGGTSAYISPSFGTAIPSNTFSGTLSNAPVSPNSITIYDGTHVIATDNGQGSLSGTDDTSPITGTIIYSTGAISIIFGAGTVFGGAVTAQYNSAGALGGNVSLDYNNPNVADVNVPAMAKGALGIVQQLNAAFATANVNVFAQATDSTLQIYSTDGSVQTIIVNTQTVTVPASDASLIFGIPGISNQELFQTTDKVIAQINDVIQASGSSGATVPPLVAVNTGGTIALNITAKTSPVNLIIQEGSSVFGLMSGSSVANNPPATPPTPNTTQPATNPAVTDAVPTFPAEDTMLVSLQPEVYTTLDGTYITVQSTAGIANLERNISIAFAAASNAQNKDITAAQVLNNQIIAQKISTVPSIPLSALPDLTKPISLAYDPVPIGAPNPLVLNVNFAIDTVNRAIDFTTPVTGEVMISPPMSYIKQPPALKTINPNLLDNSATVFSTLPGAIKTTLVRDTDYVINESAGLVEFIYPSSIGEPLVDNVLIQDLSFLEQTFTLKVGAGPTPLPASDILPFSEFTIVGEAGWILLNKPLTKGQHVEATYMSLSLGQEVTNEVLRTNSFDPASTTLQIGPFPGNLTAASQSGTNQYILNNVIDYPPPPAAGGIPYKIITSAYDNQNQVTNVTLRTVPPPITSALGGENSFETNSPPIQVSNFVAGPNILPNPDLILGGTPATLYLPGNVTAQYPVGGPFQFNSITLTVASSFYGSVTGYTSLTFVQSVFAIPGSATSRYSKGVVLTLNGVYFYVLDAVDFKPPNGGVIVNGGSTSPSLGVAVSSSTLGPVTLLNVPIIPNSVVIYDGNSSIAVDNGLGVIIGLDNASQVTGSVDYTTGSITIIFGTGSVYGEAVTVKYSSSALQEYTFVAVGSQFGQQFVDPTVLYSVNPVNFVTPSTPYVFSDVPMGYNQISILGKTELRIGQILMFQSDTGTDIAVYPIANVIYTASTNTTVITLPYNTVENATVSNFTLSNSSLPIPVSGTTKIQTKFSLVASIPIRIDPTTQTVIPLSTRFPSLQSEIQIYSGTTLLTDGLDYTVNETGVITLTEVPPAPPLATFSTTTSLPTTNISVPSTTGFPSTGTIYFESSTGLQTFVYTSLNATSFTGIAQGTGSVTSGTVISQTFVGDMQAITATNYNITATYLPRRNITAGETITINYVYFSKSFSGVNLLATMTLLAPDAFYIQVQNEATAVYNLTQTLQSQINTASGQVSSGAAPNIPAQPKNSQKGNATSVSKIGSLFDTDYTVEVLFNYYNDRINALEDELQELSGTLIGGAYGRLTAFDFTLAAFNSPTPSRLFPVGNSISTQQQMTQAMNIANALGLTSINPSAPTAIPALFGIAKGDIGETIIPSTFYYGESDIDFAEILASFSGTVPTQPFGNLVTMTFADNVRNALIKYGDNPITRPSILAVAGAYFYGPIGFLVGSILGGVFSFLGGAPPPFYHPLIHFPLVPDKYLRLMSPFLAPGLDLFNLVVTPRGIQSQAGAYFGPNQAGGYEGDGTTNTSLGGLSLELNQIQLEYPILSYFIDNYAASTDWSAVWNDGNYSNLLGILSLEQDAINQQINSLNRQIFALTTISNQTFQQEDAINSPRGYTQSQAQSALLMDQQALTNANAALTSINTLISGVLSPGASGPYSPTLFESRRTFLSGNNSDAIPSNPSGRISQINLKMAFNSMREGQITATLGYDGTNHPFTPPPDPADAEPPQTENLYNLRFFWVTTRLDRQQGTLATYNNALVTRAKNQATAETNATLLSAL